MPKTRQVHQSDPNTKEIVESLRSIGASVEYLSGKGQPDLLCGFRSQNILLEVKQEGAKLNADQSKWHARWRGQVAVVRTKYEAVNAVINHVTK